MEERESSETMQRFQSANDEEDEKRQLTKLRDQRSTVRAKIKIIRSEIARGVEMVGSRANLTMLLAQVEDLLRKSHKLTDRICMFQYHVDTAYEFKEQLYYQTKVQDIKEEVLLYFRDLS